MYTSSDEQLFFAKVEESGPEASKELLLCSSLRYHDLGGIHLYTFLPRYITSPGDLISRLNIEAQSSLAF
jgi:hypothetical protein